MSSDVCLPSTGRTQSRLTRPKSAKFSIRFNQQRPKTAHTGSRLPEFFRESITAPHALYSEGDKQIKGLKRPKTARPGSRLSRSPNISNTGVVFTGSAMNVKNDIMPGYSPQTPVEVISPNISDEIHANVVKDIPNDFLGQKCNTLNFLNLETDISNVPKGIIRDDEEYYLSMDPIDYFYNAEFDLFPVQSFQNLKCTPEKSVHLDDKFKSLPSPDNFKRTNETFLCDKTAEDNSPSLSKDTSNGNGNTFNVNKNNDQTEIVGRNIKEGTTNDTPSVKRALGTISGNSGVSQQNHKKDSKNNSIYLKPVRHKPSVPISHTGYQVNKVNSNDAENSNSKWKLKEHYRPHDDVQKKGQSRIPRPTFKTGFKNTSGTTFIEFEHYCASSKIKTQVQKVQKPEGKQKLTAVGRQFDVSHEGVYRPTTTNDNNQPNIVVNITSGEKCTSSERGDNSKEKISNSNLHLTNNLTKLQSKSDKWNTNFSKYSSVTENKFKTTSLKKSPTNLKPMKYHGNRENSYKLHDKWATSSRLSENRTLQIRQAADQRAVVNETYYHLGLNTKLPVKLQNKVTPSLIGHKRPFSEDSKFNMPPKSFIRTNFYSKVDDKVLARHAKDLTVNEKNSTSKTRPKSDRYPIPIQEGGQSVKGKSTLIPRKLGPVPLRFEEVNL